MKSKFTKKLRAA